MNFILSQRKAYSWGSLRYLEDYTKEYKFKKRSTYPLVIIELYDTSRPLENLTKSGILSCLPWSRRWLARISASQKSSKESNKQGGERTDHRDHIQLLTCNYAYSMFLGGKNNVLGKVVFSMIVHDADLSNLRSSDLKIITELRTVES